METIEVQIEVRQQENGLFAVDVRELHDGQWQSVDNDNDVDLDREDADAAAARWESYYRDGGI